MNVRRARCESGTNGTGRARAIRSACLSCALVGGTACGGPELDVLKPRITVTQGTAHNAWADEHALIVVDDEVPDLRSLQARIDEEDPLSFDGLAFRISAEHENAFDPRPRSLAEGESVHLDWRGLQQSFLLFDTTFAQGASWFRDEDWIVIAENMRNEARLASLLGAKGFLFDTQHSDPEHDAWRYDGSQSFALTEAKVESRGRQFAGALAEGYPQAVLAFTSSLTLVAAQAEAQGGDVSAIPFALFRAFLQGVVAQAQLSLPPGPTIVDGRYHTLLYDETNKFFDGLTYAERASAVTLEQPNAYRARASLGCTLSAGFVLGGSPDVAASTAQQQRAWEHDVYFSLATTDTFVFVDSGLWKNPKYAAMREALRGAREAFDAGRALGFDLYKPQLSYWDTSVVPTEVGNLAVGLTVHGSTAPAGAPGLQLVASAARGGLTFSFYVDGRRVTSDGGATAEIPAPSPGRHTFFARVLASNGEHATSAPVVRVVP